MTDVKTIIRDTIGFNFEPKELQSVNADDLLRLAAALAATPTSAAEPVAYLQEHASFGKELSFPEHQHRLTEADKKAGWSERPLYFGV